MPQPRLTIRRMMIIVAIAGCVLAIDKVIYDFLRSAAHGPEADGTLGTVGVILVLDALPVLFVVIWRLARYD